MLRLTDSFINADYSSKSTSKKNLYALKTLNEATLLQVSIDIICCITTQFTIKHQDKKI